MVEIGTVTRMTFLGFFVSHIMVTALMDGQALFGGFYPSSMNDFVQWYAATFKDPHFSKEPMDLWFQTCIGLELFVQLPYFFIASSFFWTPRSSYPNWFRIYSLIYAAQAVTAFLPVIVLVLLNKLATPSERILLASFYAPYLLVPIWLAYVMFEPTSRAPIAPMTDGMRTAMLIFFVSHVPITILIDSQTVLSIHPQLCQNVLSWYIRMLQDPLMTAPFELWFQCFCACEVTVQFAFFVVAIQQLRSKPAYPWWFGPASLLYGTHVSTTLLPILAVLSTNDSQTVPQKFMTMCIYAPYLIIPAWLAHWAATSSLRRDDVNTKKAA